ncbi:Tyrosine-protein phosphatase non-receptor type 1 [Schistosoma japonicum]|uniref:protein-tyrosine-phosphatase n=2 Tax=Schistosoma japonicum TaxID=6182 RepID=A0A4Z2CPM6_SCHJA|nr:Tyrosine-protein phosphatase non-receptor type 1 [Schistosoma japonicum]
MEIKTSSEEAFSNNMRDEMQQLDKDRAWDVVFEQLKNKSTVLNQTYSMDAARDVKNRLKNRYRDVTPFDSTRVFLCNAHDGDYINASYVLIPAVPSRKYILTQGPMQQTVSHFWLMVWEQQCPAIIMLNHLVEKGSLRCHPYFPYEGGPSVLELTDVELSIELKCETNAKIFINRKLTITNIKFRFIQTSEVHHVLHMQYTNWPDFGVPNSPSAILNFLWSVRASGAFDDPFRPSVIHCSAGIGRSGAFVLIDLALILIEQGNSISAVNIRNLFLELRQCRMGMIQTADQLRFCYRAIIKAADTLLGVPADQRPFVKFKPDNEENDNALELSSEDDSDSIDEQEEVDAFTIDNFDSEENDVDMETELFGSLDTVGVKFRNCKVDANFTQNNLIAPGLCGLESLITSEADSGIFTSLKDRFSFAADHPPNYSKIDSIPNQFYQTIGKSENQLSELPNTSNSFTESQNRNNDSLSSNRIAPSLTIFKGTKINPIFPTFSPSVISTSYLKNDISHLSEPVGLNPTLLDNAIVEDKSDSYTKEYLAASVGLHERRAARLARQARMRAHIEDVRMRMRETDMERRRWLPVHVLQYLRRYYTESGYIRNTTGAVISSILVISVISFGTIAYIYW